MFDEMLEAGVIKHNASLVVLVKKKDKTQSMCISYKGLNAMTIKDKFHIPLIEYLLEELGGARIFTKIDLRASYQQVRMKPEDIHKTAFKTHTRHYKFLVMPFGLTNATSTFQSLMNAIFKPCLRKYMSVFFDDILIYSKDEEEHLQYLQFVLETMRVNELYAKPSKCHFAQSLVDYRGHIITAVGVHTNPKKVLVVRA